MSIETYEEALAFWFSRINYEQRGMPADPREVNLDRMHELLDRLGHPESDLRILHIAGTKGKGSVAAMLDSILRQTGRRTGLFTSPHLCHVEERVQVDGQPIGRRELVVAMRAIEPHVEHMRSHGNPPTFFEVSTALGLLHFALQEVEIAILEVGLGGRCDSTNVCRPLVSVITSISFDHTQLLGNTLHAIATEKAGIIKSGRPTISGATAPEARMAIAAIAERQGSPLRELGRDFTYDYEPGDVTADAIRWPRVAVRTSDGVWPALELSFLGEHQAANAAVVVACIEELRRQGMAVDDASVREGLRQVLWPARMEVLRHRPCVVLDCAHNLASIQALLETLRTSFPASRRAFVFAGSQDKDLAGMLTLLAPHTARMVLTRYTGSVRGATVEELEQLWRNVGGRDYQVCATPAEAWFAARNWAGPDDLICATGSVFLAGELRPLMIL